ncbi:DUF2059 domain-containing protein [Phaeovulum vinaykumarii]|nr:DUF2059 domain-containing protein [Phaeovulum vinaykumarii]
MLLSVLLALPLRADPARLEQLLRMGELLVILQEEGAAYGADLDAEMLDGRGGATWLAQARAIHAPARLHDTFSQAFARALDGQDTAAMEAFLDSDLGHRVTGLELETRRAMLDPDVAAAADATAEAAQAAHLPRLAAVEDFIRRADLLDPNVTSGLNANLAFYRALVAGGGFPYDISETEMLNEVWAQAPDMRSELQGWLRSYLFAAYGPLSDDELRRYTAFCESRPGQELSRALFAGFEAMFVQVSADLGRALGQRLTGQSL